MSTGVLKFNGREFEMRGAELTAAQEMFMQGNLRAAGVTDILSHPERTIESHGEALLTALLTSGRAEYVIAAMLVEVGKRWRYDDAIATADMLAELTDRQEKQMLHSILFGVVAGFFGQGGSFSETSPNYSAQENAEQATAAATPIVGVSAAQGT
jgi:aspartokinase